MRGDLENYKLVSAVSYSKLSQLNQHPKNLIAEEKISSKALDFGSLVDCMMFTPEDMDDRFHIAARAKPQDKLGEWLDAFLAIELPADYKLNDVEKMILQARRDVGYQSNWKDETVMKKWDEEVVPYLNILAEAGEDKTVISTNDHFKAIGYQSKLITNEFTKRFFARQCKDEDQVFQVPIYYDIEGVPCKSLLDGVLIDNKNKILIPFDLKTTSDSVLNFENSFIKWNYYLQAAMYHDGLEIAGLGGITYPVADKFLFIVVNEFEEPMIWECGPTHLALGRLGGITRSGRKIKGYLQLIEDYKWHTENQLYDYPASVYKNNGVKLLDIV
jgi:hypothetical protein